MTRAKRILHRLEKELLDTKDLEINSQKDVFHDMKNFRFKATESLKSQISSETQIKDDELEEGPIFMQSWARFFIYEPKEHLTKLKFFQNPEFNEQGKKPLPFNVLNSEQKDEDDEDSDDLGSDDHGEIDIPGKDQFYLVMTKHGLHAASTRRNHIAKTQKTVPLAAIKPIIQTKKGFTGGLEDMGDYEEGFCFKVIAMAGEEEAWIICVADAELKLSWMNAITLVKGKYTAFDGGEASLEGVAIIDGYTLGGDGSKYEQTGPDGEKIKTTISGGDDKPPQVDGWWEVLQDWSTCTLKCGGGTQTQHRKCHAPTSNEGKPCIGEPIITKSCNTEPCPPDVEDSESEEDLPLKVEMMKVSDRPQRYETCIIKEGDMEVVRTDLIQFKRPPRIPARVVLNNQTFTVFQSASYDTILFSSPLDAVSIAQYPDDENCFVAADARVGVSITLCSLLTLTKITLKANRDEWVKEIGFFQANCHKQLEIAPLNLDIAKLKANGVAAEEDEAQKSAAAGSAPIEGGEKLNNVATMAIDALGKETKYEQLAEKEELDRELLQEFENRKKLEQMKLENECLEREQRQAGLGARGELKSVSLNDQINAIKKGIKDMILDQRATASKRIEMMKKMADRKARDAQGAMQDLKLKMTKSAMAAARLGDISLCDPKNPKEDKDLYCNRNFADDVGYNQDCKDVDQFCFMCCEMEAGVKHMPERNECFAKCDNKPKGGNWIWVPESNAVKA